MTIILSFNESIIAKIVMDNIGNYTVSFRLYEVLIRARLITELTMMLHMAFLKYNTSNSSDNNEG